MSGKPEFYYPDPEIRYMVAEASRVTGEDMSQLGGSILKVTKAGYNMPLSWENVVGRRNPGHYEPTGIKWVQRLGWLCGLALFKFWSLTEKCLWKFRHYESGGGYEWEPAEYRGFEQKRKWVEDAQGDQPR